MTNYIPGIELVQRVKRQTSQRYNYLHRSGEGDAVGGVGDGVGVIYKVK